MEEAKKEANKGTKEIMGGRGGEGREVGGGSGRGSRRLSHDNGHRPLVSRRPTKIFISVSFPCFRPFLHPFTPSPSASSPNRGIN